MLYFSKLNEEWTDASILEAKTILPSERLIAGLTKPVETLINPITKEILTQKYRIKYACEHCDKELETSFLAYKSKQEHLCISCKQKILSNQEETRQKKIAAIKNRTEEVLSKQRNKMKDPEINRKRIEKFKESMSLRTEEQNRITRQSKREAWASKTKEELSIIDEKRLKSCFTWKKVVTKFGIINAQGYEDKAIYKYLNLGATKIERGPCIKLDNGHNHFPDLYIELNNKKLLIEVKSQYLYDLYSEEIEYKKSQCLARKQQLNIDDYIIEIF